MAENCGAETVNIDNAEVMPLPATWKDAERVSAGARDERDGWQSPEAILHRLPFGERYGLGFLFSGLAIAGVAAAILSDQINHRPHDSPCLAVPAWTMMATVVAGMALIVGMALGKAVSKGLIKRRGFSLLRVCSIVGMVLLPCASIGVFCLGFGVFGYPR
jgi:hypothetical protein